MLPREPLPINHSWPLFERDARFDHGMTFDLKALAEAQLGSGPAHVPPVGHWSCDLRDQSLSWTDAVYDIFGLPRGAPVKRSESVALYSEPSRAVMERLRAYAIRHRRGFTLDVALRPASGGTRWMRLIAAPVCVGREVIRLEGIKRALD
ncbi:hypothetical protein ABC347_05345 [Sphingomonas sp. 1P06PA]|uniref:hypothetical protein n=1 Tax=Sphingomonas sp. 1P06PA TaxID=554121 RepID=UPI0039A54014